jgi:hypothetical protein
VGVDLPEELQRPPEELAGVDAVLDDPAFFTPFVPFFDPRMGRPSTFRYRAREPQTPAREVLCFRPALPGAAGGRLLVSAAGGWLQV